MPTARQSDYNYAVSRVISQFPETSTRAESGTPVIDLDMTGGVDFDSEASRVIDGHVEGQFLDDNTYACIFRYDLAQATKRLYGI